MKQVVDKFDDDSLKKLNSIYFSESPINLLEVTSGTNYKDDDVIKNLFKLRWLYGWTTRTEIVPI